MKIILSEYEKEYIDKYAKEYDVAVEEVVKSYIGVMDCNFEQDIADLLNENADDMRKEGGKYVDKSK